MGSATRLVLAATMSIALLFGFLDPIRPEAFVSFKRLHVFLFNLIAGGLLILYYTEGPGKISNRVRLYFALALLYTLAAASRQYVPTLILSVPLFLIVESVRIRRFPVFPFDFFRRDVPVHEKFNHASTLCLSIGLVAASLVILNNEFLKVVSLEKLTLDVFFLGYSFPISLVTMSVMFSFMPRPQIRLVVVLEEIAFWVVNLGVITFFAFIMFEMFVAEITVATMLFLAVIMIYGLFLSRAPAVQQKTFLLSGMTFLLFSALTGLLYIARYFEPSLEPYRDQMLVLHAMISLYGWNLSGLFVIMRWQDFPIQLNSLFSISLHWLIVLLLAPLGKYFPALGVAAVAGYVLLLGVVLVSRTEKRKEAR